jgi:hypothetical protein
MLPVECLPNRRDFLLKTGAAIATSFSGLALFPERASAQDDTHDWTVGPRTGFTPEIGTLVSMMAFTRRQVLMNVKGLSQQDLDFLLDARANTIGALLLHLAATDTYYGMNTFGGMKWDTWSEDIKKKWDVPMNLGDPARKAIKGNNLDYYLNALHEAREKTLTELKKRDDKWLMVSEMDEGDKVNNYGKWFHVAEHESNHDGQIKFLKSRVPGAKPSAE